jgi:hypothetical protein
MPFRDHEKTDHKNKKSEEVNIQTEHIVRVLAEFIVAVVFHNIVVGFRNAGVSLLLDSDQVIRYVITPETARCLLWTPFSGTLPIPKEEEGDEDLDIREYAHQVEP